MILEELKKLAEREDLLADEGYVPQKIHTAIAIDREGRLLGLQPRVVSVQRGKTKPRIEAMMLSVPAPEGRRTSGDSSNFLYDKPDYVFGSGSAASDRLDNRKRLFRSLVTQALDDTNDEGLRAVSKFLERFDRGEISLPLSEEDPAGYYAFQDIDDPGLLISDRPAVRSWWRKRRGATNLEKGVCILCGSEGVIVRNHPEIKNVPGGNTAGVALVSFNAPAFTSFGFNSDDSHRNAAFCRNCADSYTRALNRLLSPAYPDPHNPGQNLPPGNYRLSADTVAVFWSNGPAITSLFAPALAGDASAVGTIRNPKVAQETFAAPHAGSLPAIQAARFYSLILSGAQGRAVLRSSFDLTMGEVLRNLQQYFDDIDLVPMFANEPPVLPLFVIIRALQAPGSRSVVAGSLAQQLYESAVRGSPYPSALLDGALRRLRAGGEFNRARIAIIKAVLNGRIRAGSTNIGEEITVALDLENKQPGYRLGRLFAVLERLQADAINSPNATIVDRYFGSACATPAVVFPRLMKLAQHHASKIGRGGWYQRQIQDVINGLDADNAFPSTLSMAQQGLFSVGYYHQRADLWASKKGAETQQAEESTEA